MVNKKYRAWIILIFLAIIFISVIRVSNTSNSFSDVPVRIPTPLSSSNFNTTQDIMDSKLEAFSTLGYFPQTYLPSLQATYYALDSLQRIGRLNQINTSKLVDFIMSNFDEELNIFMDDYSRRYLDINISKTYYPLTSVLEVNCYAILSLDILNSLSLINTQDSINFIWSCYNPETSGFMGQEYNYFLPSSFKRSTLDNTYYAILTLDLLMDDWDDFQAEINELIQFINLLQSTDTFLWYFGGFYNDMDHSLDSLDIFEPNLLSSYYAIKSLDIFNSINTIRINNFYQYLGGLYNSDTYSFQMAHFVPAPGYGNIVATSLGLALSDLTGYAMIDRNYVINFILTNKDTKGIWGYSTDYIYCELIDTFQVIRCLSDSGIISQLTSFEKDIIKNGIHYFQMYKGFSLLSEDYTSANLIHIITKSFELYNRIEELDSNYIYQILLDAYIKMQSRESEGFTAGLIFDDYFNRYRSFPIEYYCSGNLIELSEFEKSLYSHISTYKALDSLNIIDRLDDFGIVNDLSDLLYNITDSQFLEVGYSNYGGFLPFKSFKMGSKSYQNSKVFMEYSFYAIRALELLVNHLGLGTINNLPFDHVALNTYINNKIIENSTHLFFQPDYQASPETLSENTYYAMYILKALDSFSLDEQKLKSFILDNIDYSNIKSVYFSYKLSKLLEIEIPLNFELIYELIGSIYSSAEKEFYQTDQREQLNQEALLWVSDIIVNELALSSIQITIMYLEDIEFLSTGNYIEFNITSRYSGEYWLWINDVIVNSSSFSPSSETFTFSLDNYASTMGDYSIRINATALDGKTDQITDSFTVYSDSTTSISIIQLPDCDFLSTGNNLTFSITSGYSGTYCLSINNSLVSSDIFSEGYNEISYSLDNYSKKLGEYSIKINVTALDGKYNEICDTFTVYTDSITSVNILSLNSYEFMTTGHNITFEIMSKYTGWYNYSIDSILLYSDTYYPGQEFIFSIDGYNVGDHNVSIYVKALDGREGVTNASFSVFSMSETIITVHSIKNHLINSTGNFVNFSIHTNFPDWYFVKIDGILVDEAFYESDEYIICSIDGYDLGTHMVFIWANSSDGKKTDITIQFTVYTISFIEIRIIELDNYEFRTISHEIIFLINSSFPDTYELFIDGILLQTDAYLPHGQFFTYSIDHYQVGEHDVLIWANSTDGKEVMCETSFTVYSLSNTIVGIEELDDYEFLSEDNYVKFNVTSFYPDYYKILIDGIEVQRSNYSSGVSYYFCIDGYGVGLHTIFIWAIGEDDKVGTAYAEFFVFSNTSSNVIISIYNLKNYEFMSKGNVLNFSIFASFPDYYELWIDDKLVKTDNFMSNEFITYSLNSITSIIGDHIVFIRARGLDGNFATIRAEFIIFSTSITIITINYLKDCEHNTFGNYLMFTIDSKYPDYYELWIDDILVATDSFEFNNTIIFSLDNYTNNPGIHKVYIWAIGLDGKVAEVEVEFKVSKNGNGNNNYQTQKMAMVPLMILYTMIPGSVIIYTTHQITVLKRYNGASKQKNFNIKE